MLTAQEIYNVAKATGACLTSWEVTADWVYRYPAAIKESSRVGRGVVVSCGIEGRLSRRSITLMNKICKTQQKIVKLATEINAANSALNNLVECYVGRKRFIVFLKKDMLAQLELEHDRYLRAWSSKYGYGIGVL